ncbi:hypothetical protein [Thermomonas haemolytica]|uniref:hypothetical protein n=3 Tax=Gammaproteobacteria TaxID=1236 RepID=UPI0014773A6E|nr:hypothetical protein [Thermomonas haemolytica]
MKLLVSAVVEHVSGGLRQARTLKNKAMQICDQLATLRTAQDAAAQLVPAFAP